MRKALEVCLVEPQIPPNTGNIARLCAALDIPLHLVGRLGFEMDDKAVRRAGLDYWPLVTVQQHPDLDSFLGSRSAADLFFFSTHGRRTFWEACFSHRSVLIFGNEGSGLPLEIHRKYGAYFYRIPMLDRGVRSLNLSSAVAVAVYEAQRQLRLDGADPSGSGLG